MKEITEIRIRRVLDLIPEYEQKLEALNIIQNIIAETQDDVKNIALDVFGKGVTNG